MNRLLSVVCRYLKASMPSQVANENASVLTLAAKSSFGGSNDETKAQVLQWLVYSEESLQSAIAAKDNSKTKECVKFIDLHLAQKTFMVGHQLTLADVAVYARIHEYMATLNRKGQLAVKNVSRHFALVENLVALEVGEFALPAVKIELDVPYVPKVQEKKVKSEAKEVVENKKEKKKEKETTEKPKTEQKGQGKKEANSAVGPNPSMIDLRVGHVLSVKRHPDADSLFVEEIDVGEEQPRIVCSGLVNAMAEEEILNRKIVVVCNLKPVAMRGIKSMAMVLCATSEDKAKVEFVEPPAASKPGDKVYADGFNGTPEAVLNPKKKIFETVQPHLFTTGDGIAAYKHKVEGQKDKICLFKTDAGVCTVATIVGGSLK